MTAKIICETTLYRHTGNQLASLHLAKIKPLWIQKQLPSKQRHVVQSHNPEWKKELDNFYRYLFMNLLNLT